MLQGVEICLTFEIVARYPRPQRLSAVAENRQAHELGTMWSIDLKFNKDGPAQSEGAIQKL